jgi:cation diffusion facilitator family transporter
MTPPPNTAGVLMASNIQYPDKRFDEMRAARHVFAQTFSLNLFVAISKLICGTLTNTLSMIADGFHSMLDASSNIIGIVALTIAIKPADAGHPYGHRKFEALAAMAISFLLFFAGFNIITQAADRMLFGGDLPVATPVSYVVMGITIIINIAVTIYERKKAKVLNSKLLHADSEHTLSDIYVSLSVVAAILSAQFHIYWIDLAASIFIVVALIKASYGIIAEHLGSLVDAAVFDSNVIEQTVNAIPGVVGCHRIRSRGMHEHVFLDLHVEVPQNLTVEQGHNIASAVEATLKEKNMGIVDVTVHIEGRAT